MLRTSRLGGRTKWNTVNALFLFISKSLSLHIHVIHNEQQCVLKQCGVWKHWLRDPLTPSEKATLREKEREWWSQTKAVRSSAKQSSECSHSTCVKTTSNIEYQYQHNRRDRTLSLGHPAPCQVLCLLHPRT